MRVLCLVPLGGAVHGAQRVSQALVDSFRQFGCEVDVVDMAHAHDARDLGRFRLEKVRRGLLAIARALALATSQSRVYVNVTPHGFALVRDLIAVVLLRLVTPHITAHLHAVPSRSATRALLVRCLRNLRVIAVNSQVAAALGGDARRDLQVMTGFPDMVRVDPSEAALVRRQSNRKLLFVGRLREQKGVVEAIRIYRAVARRFPDATLTVVGGEEESDVVAEVREAVADDSGVDYVGELNPQALAVRFDEATALLLTSRPYSEGVPIVALEAAMFGVPVVSTPQSDAETWLHGNGFVHDGASDEGLARTVDYLGELFEDAERYRLAAQAGRRLYETNFDYHLYLERMIRAVYR